MHSYPHHIGDFNTATQYLSRLERSIYRDALDMYYDSEQALDGSDFARLARRLRCLSTDEQAALQFVLDEYFDFDIESSRHVHQRCERELEAYRQQQAAKGEVKKSVNKRQQVLREERKRMFDVLRSAGVVLAWNVKQAELRKAYAQHAASLDLSRPGHAYVTANQEPKTLNQEIPPNPPAGGGCAADQLDSQQPAGQQPDGQPAGSAAAAGMPVVGQEWQAVAAQLAGYFPEQRRVRLGDVALLLQELVEGGGVTVDQVVTAAAAQSALLRKDDGKACPALLRWLKESRWLDTALCVTGGVSGVTGVTGGDSAGVVDANWNATRSGVEAMGKLLGMEPWDSDVEKSFRSYEARVAAKLQAQQAVAA